jgi:hypothetical protein
VQQARGDKQTRWWRVDKSFGRHAGLILPRSVVRGQPTSSRHAISTKLSDPLDRDPHLLLIDLMHVDGLADCGQHGHGQSAAEVLAELFESGEERLGVGERRIV